MTAVTVTVQNMAGDLFYVEMLGTQRVGELKRRLQQQQPHMAASRQQLILMPRDGEEDATRMADSKLLNSYCITSDMTVYLILTDFQDFSADECEQIFLALKAGNAAELERLMNERSGELVLSGKFGLIPEAHRDTRIEMLCQVLQYNTTVQSLDLGGNQAPMPANKVAWAVPMAAVLAVNNSLKLVSLVRAELGDADIIELCGALELNTGLEQLYLSNNRFSNVGARAILNMLQVNKTLQVVNIGSDSISMELTNAIRAACRENRKRQQEELAETNEPTSA